MKEWVIFVAVIFSFVIGVWVGMQYQLRCRCSSKRRMLEGGHGALEAWVTAFGLNFLLMYFTGRSRPDSWIVGVIGAGLLLFVARRFWLNWEHKA